MELETQRRLLNAAAKCGTLVGAARQAGVSAGYVYSTLKGDARFAEEFESAMQMHAAVLYEKALARALGTDGRRGSDKMLLQILEAKLDAPGQGAPKAPSVLLLRRFDSTGGESGYSEIPLLEKPKPAVVVPVSGVRIRAFSTAGDPA
jgi:hypothetical protein